MGSYLFLRDLSTGDWWSATAEPKTAPGEQVQTLFNDDKASFIKVVGALRSEVECIVISEGNGEGRRITLFNEGDTDRHIEVTSFAELVLSHPDNDNAHPAFSKMFVETEISPDNSAIFAHRRKRTEGEPDICVAHFITDPAGPTRDREAETDRRAFLGRGRTIVNAAAFDPGARLSASQGFVLDPIMSLRRRVRVPANKKVALTFWTVVAKQRSELEAAIGHLDHPESFGRQSTLSWTRSQVQTRHFGLSLSDAANVQRLARYLIYPNHHLRSSPEAIAAGLGRQSALWPMAISGDFPIFAVRIADVADLEIVAQALRYQEYMRSRGLVADFVVINEQAASYVADLQNAIENLCENSRLRGREFGPRQHIFAVRRDLMDDSSYRTLLGVARVIVHTRNGTIFDQIERAETAAIQEQEVRVIAPPETSGSRTRTVQAETSGQPAVQWRGARLLERHRRFRPRRPRLCRSPDRRPDDATAMGERHRQRLLRLPHFGRRRILQLEPQQPRLPADAVVERCRCRTVRARRSTSTIWTAARPSHPMPPCCAMPRCTMWQGTARA